MRKLIFRKAIRDIQTALSGVHMLAFLPAMCLAAYWIGGEILLVTFALFPPLLYAATGGFSAIAAAPRKPVSTTPDMAQIAQDFLDIAHHNGQTTACIQLGISGLDDIARTLGDAAAQDAREMIQGRLSSALRGSDHVFATGETRLTVFVAPGFRLKLDGLLALSKRLRIAVEDPISIAATTRYLSADIGIASSLNFGRNITPESWIAAASQALGEATKNGPSSTRVWSEKLSQSCGAKHALREDLREAFDKGQIQAYFQPQVSLRTGEIVGMEALARWEHPTRGVIAPKEFLRALHDSGETERMGRTMLHQSLAALSQWEALGLSVPAVGINLSAFELRNPGLSDQIEQRLDRSGFQASRLRIEVSERSVSDGADDMMLRNLNALADLGCRIDLDDFGVGKAALGSLQLFPVHRIKIDRSLIRDVDTSETRTRLLRGVIALADHLTVETLAEGVETVNEHGVVRELGCTFGQGFLFAKPMSANACATWLGANPARQPNDQPAQLRLQ